MPTRTTIALLGAGLWLMAACARPPASPSPTTAAPAPASPGLTTTPAFPASPAAAEPVPQPPAPGRVYYAAPDGDDANPGTQAAPWQHPAVAAARLAPGDTLVLRPGVYPLADYERDIVRPPAGRADAWIVIRGEKRPNPPPPSWGGNLFPLVLSGRDNLAALVDLSGARYVWLEHLELTHDPQAADPRARDGIVVLGAPAAHLVLTDLYIHHLDEFGMNLQDVRDLLIAQTRITHTGFGALGGPAGEHGGWQQVTVRDTLLAYSGHYYQGGDGHDRPYDRPDGLGIEPSAGPVVLERVRAEHNYGDGLDSKAAVTVIRDSIVANNTCDGVKLWGQEGVLENVLIYGRGDGDATVTPWAALVIDTTTPQARFSLTHVTLDDALGHNYLLYVQYDHPEVPVHLTWRNLILSARGPDAAIYLAPAVTLDAQAVLFHFPQSAAALQHGPRAYLCADLAVLGPGLLCGDPRFMQPAWGQAGDYHLVPGSPARDAGVPTRVAHDLDGRPRDDRPDLGAYEGP